MITSRTLPDVRIRRELRPGDLGYIAHLHGQLYARECGYGLHFEGYVLAGLQEFAEQYDPAKDAVWICEHDDKMVGFLLGFHRVDALQLRYFIFQPDYRGLGLGKKLMQEFLAFMHKKQYHRAYLWTTQEQTAAIALYTRFGFQLTEEKNSVAFDKELVEQRYDLLLPA
ncbi:GNAT family N-acetyltransferase [Hymenobacter crusticola]|uniref:GNAT family N-acetyltransferase n=1 Tax=Hymenobacter crusticola TaxID=1770526 RepID=A0A243W7E9_9BACT|nr:GNAT family N-acetyltransferase [Hymenobacter crusticola]OUJ70376.1 GNAT family N-acetyltransferase [Hymenobacter crusticola]